MNKISISLLSLVIVSLVAVYFSFIRNYPPELTPDFQRLSSSPASVDVLSNDKDTNEDKLAIVSVVAPDGIRASIQDSGAIEVSYGPDAFGTYELRYSASDGFNEPVESDLVLEIPFAPSVFNTREGAALMPEILQEPPTTVYGSTIDVFLFRDESGALREITIAGHADSTTCRETSGAFSGALMVAGRRDGDFLLAGSGRMQIPQRGLPLGEAEEAEPMLGEYLRLSTSLALAKELVANGLMSADDVSALLQSSPDEAEQRLNELEKEPHVAEFLESVRPTKSALGFERAVDEIARKSGLLRTHEVPYKVLKTAEQRVQNLAEQGESHWVSFSDLLSNGGMEGVIFLPVYRMGEADPLEISIPIGEFSEEGFRNAAREHRSAIEDAVDGNARKRLKHAEEQISQNQRQLSLCDEKTDDELSRVITLNQICDKDGCREVTFGGEKVTYRDYCSTKLPTNIEIAKSWKLEAQEILSELEAVKQRVSGTELDDQAHAALIDSMLRNWALPIPDAQAAFDKWRSDGRSRAWLAIAKAMKSQGLSWSSLAGENIVFDSKLTDSELQIRPMMVIDLKRSVVVGSAKVGFTVAYSPWMFRSAENLGEAVDGRLASLELLASNQSEFRAALSENPELAIKSLLRDLRDNYAPDSIEWLEFAHKARMYQLGQFEAELDEVLRTLEQSDELLADDNLTILTFLPFLTDSAVEFTPEIRLRAAMVIAGVMLQAGGFDEQSALNALRDVKSGKYPFAMSSVNSKLLFGDSARSIIRNAIQVVQRQDADFEEKFFGVPFPTRAISVLKRELAAILDSPRPTLVSIVGRVEKLRSLMITREVLDTALRLFDEEGRVRVPRLIETLSASDKKLTVGERFLLHRIITNMRFVAGGSKSLGPIEGLKLQSLIVSEFRDLDIEINQYAKEIDGLRFGRDQEVLTARAFFDEGNYVQALERMIPDMVPLSLYRSRSEWVANKELQLDPDQIEVVSDDGLVKLVARSDNEVVEIVTLNGLSKDLQGRLMENAPQQVLPWNEGEPLTDQLLLNLVPAPSAISEARQKVFSNEFLRVDVLKAIVYSCAMPAQELVDPVGRCAQSTGSTLLHDRAKGHGSIRFSVPNREKLVSLVSDRLELQSLEQFVNESGVK